MNGYYGPYGGSYVPEMLVPALKELDKAFNTIGQSSEFKKELTTLFNTYSGRPTPLYFAPRATKELGGGKIYLKLESLNHTGAHKINNALGQALLAKAMGKKHLIAETGAGQHGLATATVAAKLGMDCKIFMGDVDIRRQYPNVYAMRLLGAEVIPVTDGTKTLKDAVNAAMKFWISHLKDTHYLLGSALGPAPFPAMVREFQSVIGKEVKEDIQKREGRLPDHLMACVGGGSNAIGLFSAFLNDEEVALHGVEAGGRGPAPGDNAARFSKTPSVGIVQGYKSYFLQDEQGQVLPTHSVSAGLDYAGVGPQLAHLYDEKRITFTSVTDKEVLNSYKWLCRTEGIIPALESSHAVAELRKFAPTTSKDDIIVVNISGRGDKDLFITAPYLDRDNWLRFLENEVNQIKGEDL